ncbi:MAG: universal stress protein [Armatimonadota bacterium]
MNIQSTYQPKVILAPTDFSLHSALALRYAALAARRFGAHLRVLHAHQFEPPLEFTSRQVNALARSEERNRRALYRHLKQHVLETIGELGDLELVVAESPPVEAIVGEARTAPADLVVMGTHGRSGVNRLLMGSVAENVVRRVHCPVLTVRRKEGSGAGEEEPRIEKLLLPLTATEASLQSAGVACAVAKHFEAEITVVYVTEPGETGHPEPFSWVPDEMRQKCTFKTVLRSGNAAEQIISLAREAECDLVVIAAQHRPFFDVSVFGSTTDRVMRHAPCPVLIVPSGLQISHG